MQAKREKRKFQPVDSISFLDLPQLVQIEIIVLMPVKDVLLNSSILTRFVQKNHPASNYIWEQWTYRDRSRITNYRPDVSLYDIDDDVLILSEILQTMQNSPLHVAALNQLNSLTEDLNKLKTCKTNDENSSKLIEGIQSGLKRFGSMVNSFKFDRPPTTMHRAPDATVYEIYCSTLCRLETGFVGKQIDHAKKANKSAEALNQPTIHWMDVYKSVIKTRDMQMSVFITLGLNDYIRYTTEPSAIEIMVNHLSPKYTGFPIGMLQSLRVPLSKSIYTMLYSLLGRKKGVTAQQRQALSDRIIHEIIPRLPLVSHQELIHEILVHPAVQRFTMVRDLCRRNMAAAQDVLKKFICDWFKDPSCKDLDEVVRLFPEEVFDYKEMSVPSFVIDFLANGIGGSGIPLWEGGLVVLMKIPAFSNQMTTEDYLKVFRCALRSPEKCADLFPYLMDALSRSEDQKSISNCIQNIYCELFKKAPQTIPMLGQKDSEHKQVLANFITPDEAFVMIFKWCDELVKSKAPFVLSVPQGVWPQLFNKLSLDQKLVLSAVFVDDLYFNMLYHNPSYNKETLQQRINKFLRLLNFQLPTTPPMKLALYLFKTAEGVDFLLNKLHSSILPQALIVKDAEGNNPLHNAAQHLNFKWILSLFTRLDSVELFKEAITSRNVHNESPMDFLCRQYSVVAIHELLHRLHPHTKRHIIINTSVLNGFNVSQEQHSAQNSHALQQFGLFAEPPTVLTDQIENPFVFDA